MSRLELLMFIPIVFLIVFYTQPSFAHGVGGEILPPVTIGNKNATLSLNINPPVFDPNSNEYEILIKLYETNTQAIIPHVTYLIEMSKDDKQIFSERFHDDVSNLSIKVVPKNTSELKIDGTKYGDLGWMKKSDFFPLKLEGPVFLSGGLYKLHIEVLTIDSDSKLLANKISYNTALSLAEKTEHPILYAKNNYDIGVMSYYDTINDFMFDNTTRTMSFSMPFEWSEQNIGQTSVVHEEIHIPKTFGEMLVTKYDATVNGIPIPETGVTIDDYSTDSRIVHLVLNQKELFSIINSVSDKSKMTFTVAPSKEEKLPLLAYTHNAVFQIGLSWDPIPITAGQNMRFFVDITRYFAPKIPENAKFDFVIKQHGNEIYRKSIDGMIGVEKANFIDFTFTKEMLGPAIISIEKINGVDLASADYVVVVQPEIKNTFPIRIPSQMQDNSKGNYVVDFTWIPENLQPGESEFIFTIYDKDNQPVRNAKYDFVLIQNDQEIYRKSGIASAGGSFEDFTFFEKNKGTVTLRIENINQSKEHVEIPISITPEFPLGWLLVICILFSMMIVLTQLNIKHGQITRHPLV